MECGATGEAGVPAARHVVADQKSRDEHAMAKPEPEVPVPEVHQVVPPVTAIIVLVSYIVLEMSFR